MRHAWRRTVVACGVLLSSLAGAAEDAESEQFDWPVEGFFLTDLPQIQEAVTVQTETALLLRKTTEGSEFDASFAGEVGLGNRLQLSSEVEWSREEASDTLERGVSEISLGLHLGLLESSQTGLSVSTGLDGELPLGDFSDDRWVLYGRLLAFKQLGDLGLSGIVRPGVAYTEQHEYEPRAELGLAAAWGSGMLVPTAEVHAELGGEVSFEAAAGLKLKPNESLELGAGALLGEHEGGVVYGATVSLLFELGG